MLKRNLVISTIICWMLASQVVAAPDARLWERWNQYDDSSTAIISHIEWQQMLDHYLVTDNDGLNRFSYGSVTGDDRSKLKRYLRHLSNIKVSQINRNEQWAFWINMYNALTIDVVLDHYPVKSIRDISSGFFSSGPWGKSIIKVEGEDLTLNDIEHRILRPIWRDPRIHYAVNCASIGCPNLRKEVFTANNIESLLDKSARQFINHPRAVRILDGDLQVSSIYDWFVDDFGGTDQTVIEHLKHYANPALFARLKQVDRIDDDFYDWSINAAD
jgi:hypothetical protein